MDELYKLLKSMFPSVDFENRYDLVDSKQLDSFDLFNLISAIEQSYEISISWEDISVENFNSANAMYCLIERLSPK